MLTALIVLSDLREMRSPNATTDGWQAGVTVVSASEHSSAKEQVLSINQSGDPYCVRAERTLQSEENDNSPCGLMELLH
ncbi:hypothetical protein AOLI_G00171150 [Acnodon oligacanthus]